jgi:hypothetical protein
MNWAGGDQTEIPDRPRNGAFAETTGTYTRFAKIELITAHGLAAKEPLLESPRPSVHFTD